MLTTALKASVAVVLAAMRIAGQKSPTFQAVAHIYVTGLFVGWWLRFDLAETEGQAERWAPQARVNLALAVGLTVVEVACFLLQRGT